MTRRWSFDPPARRPDGRRVAAGHSKKRIGDEWEAAVVGMLSACMSRGILDGFEHVGIPTKYVKKRGVLTLVPTSDEAPVDFLAWGSAGTWKFDAKHSSKERWSFGELKDHQAEALTSWHNPDMYRYAGLALRYVTRGERNTHQQTMLWLPWPVVGPLWQRWRDGKAKRGEASLTVAQAEDIGVPWTSRIFEATP